MLNPPKIIVLPPASERQKSEALASHKPLVKFTSYNERGTETPVPEREPVLDKPTQLARGHLVVSCECCGKIVRYKEYKEHMLGHCPNGVSVSFCGTGLSFIRHRHLHQIC